MITGIRQKAVVGEGGKIEILTSELPSGALVEVIVLVEPVEQDTTEYLLSTEANRNHLLEALQDLEKPSTYVYVDPADL
jgi:antitoxin YefM